MGFKPPDSVGHGHAHQEIAIAYVMNFRANDSDPELHSW